MLHNLILTDNALSVFYKLQIVDYQKLISGHKAFTHEREHFEQKKAP